MSSTPNGSVDLQSSIAILKSNGYTCFLPKRAKNDPELKKLKADRRARVKAVEKYIKDAARVSTTRTKRQAAFVEPEEDSQIVQEAKPARKRSKKVTQIKTEDLPEDIAGNYVSHSSEIIPPMPKLTRQNACKISSGDVIQRCL